MSLSTYVHTLYNYEIAATLIKINKITQQSLRKGYMYFIMLLHNGNIIFIYRNSIFLFL